MVPANSSRRGPFAFPAPAQLARSGHAANEMSAQKLRPRDAPSPHIRFMIEPRQMQQPMKDQHLDFNRQRMPVLRAWRRAVLTLMARSPAIFMRDLGAGWKREHIRRLVLSAKLPVQTPDRCIGGQQHCHLAAQFHGSLRLTQKTGERPRIRNALLSGENRFGRSFWASSAACSCGGRPGSKSGSRRIIVRGAATAAAPCLSIFYANHAFTAAWPDARLAAAPAGRPAVG